VADLAVLRPLGRAGVPPLHLIRAHLARMFRQRPPVLPSSPRSVQTHTSAPGITRAGIQVSAAWCPFLTGLWRARRPWSERRSGQTQCGSEYARGLGWRDSQEPVAPLYCAVTVTLLCGQSAGPYDLDPATCRGLWPTQSRRIGRRSTSRLWRKTVWRCVSGKLGENARSPAAMRGRLVAQTADSRRADLADTSAIGDACSW